MTKAEWQAKREDFLKRYEAWKVWKKQRLAEMQAALEEVYGNKEPMIEKVG